MDRLPARLASKIFPEPMSGCWLWTGAWASKGYGHTKYQAKIRLIHRVVFTLLVGREPLSTYNLWKLCIHPAHRFYKPIYYTICPV